MSQGCDNGPVSSLASIKILKRVTRFPLEFSTGINPIPAWNQILCKRQPGLRRSTNLLEIDVFQSLLPVLDDELALQDGFVFFSPCFLVILVHHVLLPGNLALEQRNKRQCRGLSAFLNCQPSSREADTLPLSYRRPKTCGSVTKIQRALL